VTPVEHYRTLLLSRPWCAEGLSWTVIQPAGAPVTVQEVARRLHAEQIDLDEVRFPHVSDLRDDDPSPFLVAHLAPAGDAVMMLQTNGFQGARPEVLRLLSDRARVHNVDWTINGNGGVSYAVYGNLLTWIDKNNPDRRGGTHPDTLDEDLADLREARRLNDEAQWPANQLAAEAAALATVERRTVLRLSSVGGPPWQTFMLGRIPSDPQPPGEFGRDDPDLDARLRGAPVALQREAVALVLRRLTDTFVISDEPAATAVIAAVRSGEPADRDLQTLAFRLHAVTPDRTLTAADGSTLGVSIIGQAFHRAVANPHGDPLDSLRPARLALSHHWPEVRGDLNTLIARTDPAAPSP
jgi:hypothetical protein